MLLLLLFFKTWDELSVSRESLYPEPPPPPIGTGSRPTPLTNPSETAVYRRYGRSGVKRAHSAVEKRRARVHSRGAICARRAAAAGDGCRTTATAAAGARAASTYKRTWRYSEPENRFRPRPPPQTDRRGGKTPCAADTRLYTVAASRARARTYARTTRPPLPRAAELYRPMTAGCFPEKSLRAQCHKARRGATSPPFSRHLVTVSIQSHSY